MKVFFSLALSHYFQELGKKYSVKKEQEEIKSRRFIIEQLLKLKAVRNIKNILEGKDIFVYLLSVQTFAISINFFTFLGECEFCDHPGIDGILRTKKILLKQVDILY